MTGAELGRIDALLDLGRYDEVVVLVRRVMASDGDAAGNAELWCRLSLAELRLDHDAEALDAANHACALAPDNDWPHRLASHQLSGIAVGPVDHPAHRPPSSRCRLSFRL